MGDLAFERFNQREVEILTLIADGLSNREIAQKLSLTQETIEGYNRQIFAKWGVSSRTEAVSAAKKHRFMDSAQALSVENGEELRDHSCVEKKSVNHHRHTLLHPGKADRALGLDTQADETIRPLGAESQSQDHQT